MTKIPSLILQSCTHVVFYVAAMHSFTIALICCTTFLAFQNLLLPPTLLHPNSHIPMPLQPKLCNCKAPGSYLLCSLVSTPHSEVCPCTGFSWAVCACGTPWGHAYLLSQHAPHAINCSQLHTPAGMSPPVRDGWYPNFPGIGYQGHLTRKVSGIVDTVSILAILDTRHSILNTRN